MTARAHIEDDFLRDGVAIYLGQKHDGVTDVMAFDDPTWVRSDTAVTTGPSLRLPESVARALYDALAVHFHGVSDTQTLRTDYLAERRRVDQLITYLTGGNRG